MRLSAPESIEAQNIDARIVDEAIAWAVKLDFNTPSPETRRAFEAWLALHPLHASAWQRVRSLQDDFVQLPPKLALDTLGAVEARRQAHGLQRRQAARLLALAGVAVASGWSVREYAPWQRLLADSSTATGEQRTLRMADGTVIELNTDSAISTEFDVQRRLVRLQRGEILIATGADVQSAAAAKRPFWVQTPFGTVQALGTRFVVRLEPGRARVSVQQGAVQMHPAHGASPATVQPGESWWLAAAGASPAALPDIAVDGWADGVIAGQNMRLDDLLAELSRYRSGRIVCDARVAGLRLSGVFHVRDTDQVLQFLVQTQPVSVVFRTRFWVSVGPGPAA